MSRDNPDYAFPWSALTPNGPVVYADSRGMTLRQWYAGQAIGPLLTNALAYNDEIRRMARGESRVISHDITVSDAFRIADMMLAECEK